MHAYPIYPDKSRLPTWVLATLSGLGALFVILTIAVTVAVIRSSSVVAPTAIATVAVAPAAVSPAAPPPAAAPPVAPAAVVATRDDAPPATARKSSRRAVKRHHGKRTVLASRTGGRKHRKDDLDKLLGL